MKMGFSDKIIKIIKSFLPDIKFQLTEKGTIHFGGKHYHINRINGDALAKLLTPEFENKIVNATLDKLKAEDTPLGSLSENDLNQKVFMSTIASTAEILEIRQVSDKVGISENVRAVMSPATESSVEGDIGETASPLTVVSKTRSTGPPDDNGETM